MFALRFDFRNPAFAGIHMADRYQAGIEMAEWGRPARRSQHHHLRAPRLEDGYLPSSLPITAAMAARTTNVRFNLAAMIAPFHDPSGSPRTWPSSTSSARTPGRHHCGRVRARGIRDVRSRDERAGRACDRGVTTLKQALTGEPFEFRGRTVRITPAPFQKGGPQISMGGSSEPAAAGLPASPTDSCRRSPRSGPSTRTMAKLAAGPRPVPGR